jgi:pimeloyl-ACP methyl ester carboxylesterase
MPLHPRLHLTLRIIRAPLLALAAVALGLAGCQGRLIYHPQPYRPDLASVLPKQVEFLPFTTSQGRQTAFWLPPRAGGVPDRVWMCFTGNGDLTLSWLPVVQDVADSNVGFLFVDYPGYGLCEGSCTPGRILASSEAAVVALAQHLALSSDQLDQRMAVLGHSLGCAAALQYAACHPVRRVVLVSPFTSMLAMARRIVGWPLCYVLWHRFDNVARLDDLALRVPPPPVTILHGDMDEMIPVQMGRDLAASHPTFVTLYELPNGGHNDILALGQDAIRAALVGP